MADDAYWTCRIGPVDRDKLPNWADSPLRKAVANAFLELIGRDAQTVSSGWGRKEEESPWLGFATTRELLQELKARGEVSAFVGEYPETMGDMAIGAAKLLDGLPGSMLDYRTVDRE